MHNSQNKIDAAKNLVNSFSSKDPIIKIHENSIEFSPFYLNSNLLLNYIPILICIVAIFQNYGIFLNLVFTILAVIILLLIIKFQFRSYNYISLNLKKEIVIIKPNIFFKKKPQTKFSFKEVKKVYYVEDCIIARNRRFTIYVKLNTGEKHLILSTGKQDNAYKIVRILISLF